MLASGNNSPLIPFDILVQQLAGQDEMDSADFPNGAMLDSTVSELKSELDALADRLREPAPLDPYFDEAECRRGLSIVAEIGHKTFSSHRLEGQGGLGMLGEYHLLSQLGRGGMGTVYKAIHVKLGKEVALKVLPHDKVQDDVVIARFEREMMIVGKFEHPNIVQARDAGVADGRHYLVMELIDGEDLSAVVRRTGPLPVRQACDMILQAAIGLQHAHAQGVIHRDLKPSNLILNSNGTVKILDLGLAMLTHPNRADEFDLTSPVQVMGTLCFMPPEQTRSTHSVNEQADIYSLGATLYCLLSGHPPLSDRQSATVAARLSDIETVAPTPLATLRDDVPIALSDFVDRMLAKSPESRPQSADEIRDTLSRILGKSGESESPVALNIEKQSDVPAPPAAALQPDSEVAKGDVLTNKRMVRMSMFTAAVLVIFGIGYAATRQFYSAANPAGQAANAEPSQDRSNDDSANNVTPLTREQLVALPIADASAIAMDQNGKHFFAAQNNEIEQWNTQTSESVQKLNAHTEKISMLKVSNDGRYLISGSADGTAIVWNLETGKPLCTLPEKGFLSAVAISSDNRTAVTASGPNPVVWDVKTAKAKGALLGMSRNVWATSLVITPDNQYVIGASKYPTVHVWNLKTGRPIAVLETEKNASVSSLAISPDGAVLVAGGSWGLQSWKTKTWKTLFQNTHPQGVNMLQFTQDGKWIIGHNAIWDLEGRLKKLLPIAGNNRSLVSQDGKWIMHPGNALHPVESIDLQ